MRRHISLLILTGVALACSETVEQEDDRTGEVLKENQHTVEVVELRKGVFATEIVSNGRIMSGRYVDIYWESDGTIEDITKRNGDMVRTGETLAALDAYRLENSLSASKASKEQTRLSMLDFLIGQGYEITDTAIPSDIMDLAMIKSGYRQAEINYEMSLYERQHSELKAPFDGVIANIESIEGNRADRTKPFCRVIDTESMMAEFSVIENELSAVFVGAKVHVEAYSNPGVKMVGVIESVNPVVEQNGMIRVRARIEKGHRLFVGMNVKVTVESSIKECLSVPKSALVLRTGRKVIFTSKNGKALWNYVETAEENTHSIVVTSGLNEGDSVIVSGNIDLAHESDITIKR